MRQSNYMHVKQKWLKINLISRGYYNMSDEQVHFVIFVFLLQNGKHDEAWMILKQVHDTNMRAKGYPERVFSVSPTQESHALRSNAIVCVQEKKSPCMCVCL